jgi:hypothetical protein
MAVTGVPEPRADHAVAMCKFARECLSKMHGLLSGLEATLGPGKKVFAVATIMMLERLH